MGELDLCQAEESTPVHLEGVHVALIELESCPSQGGLKSEGGAGVVGVEVGPQVRGVHVALVEAGGEQDILGTGG